MGGFRARSLKQSVRTGTFKMGSSRRSTFGPSCSIAITHISCSTMIIWRGKGSARRGYCGRVPRRTRIGGSTLLQSRLLLRVLFRITRTMRMPTSSQRCWSLTYAIPSNYSSFILYRACARDSHIQMHTLKTQHTQVAGTVVYCSAKGTGQLPCFRSFRSCNDLFN